MHLGEENAVTAGEVSIAVKTLKAGKPAGCVEIRHKILKALNQEVFFG